MIMLMLRMSILYTLYTEGACVSTKMDESFEFGGPGACRLDRIKEKQ
jgi:hypothetical protein